MNEMRLEIKEDFDKLQCTETMKEETKQYIRSRIYHKKRRGLKAAFSFTVILLVCGFSYWFYFLPVAAISLEGDTSIQLQINRFDRVVDVTTYDEQGKHWCKELNPWHQCYEDILQSLQETEELSITVYSDDDHLCQKIYENTKECTRENEQIQCHMAQHTKQQNAQKSDKSQTHNHYKKVHHD